MGDIANRYQHGKIYRIISDNLPNRVYIGSTCKRTVAQRLAEHVWAYHSFLRGKSRNTSSSELIAAGNYHIFLIELFPCNSRDELLARERFHIEANRDTCVNIAKPIITEDEQFEQRKQYYEDHKEEILLQCKQYYEAHKEHIDKRNKEYNEAHKEEVAEYQKRWHEEHKETQNAAMKARYEATKEVFNAHRREKIICTCGEQISRGSMSQHVKSKRHINEMLIPVQNQ